MAKKTSKEKSESAPTDTHDSLKLVILDSHGLLHSSYHAMPDLSSSKGEPTGALYGLIARTLKIAEDLKPDYIVAARDLPGATHRHETFAAYKATRAQTDDALISQLKRAPDVFEAMGIPVYSYEAYEADDVIGTIVKKVSPRADLRTFIVTGDMDMYQLISDRTFVYKTGFSVNDVKLYDTDAVEARFGFGPKGIIDYKGIVGDTSDNIPGVPGVGDVTAKKLIATYGSLEGIYDVLQRKGVEAVRIETGLRKSYLEKIMENRTQAFFSKQLATIHTDVPIQFELPKRQWHLIDHLQTTVAMCEELDFRSLRERVKMLTRTGEEKPGELADLEEPAPQQTVDEEQLREISVAMWLLKSDLTNPTLEDIYTFAHTEDFGKAREYIFNELRSTGRLLEVFEHIEKPLIPIAEKMHTDGIRVDAVYLKTLEKEYGKGLAELAGRIYKHAGHEFNINSPKQLGDVLYDELKISSGGRQKKTAGGARTTREDELVKMADVHPIIRDILAYRELQKLLSTYIEKMPALIEEDKRIHARFVQAGTTTGRMASIDPNLQNIPVKTESGRRIRTAFVAEPGNVLIAIDYSQIELRIAAGISGDEKLIHVFQSGGDVHTAVASEVFEVPPELVDREMRRRAKVINFGILYGMGVNALRANLGDAVPREDAAKYLEEYFKNFSGVARYIAKTKAEVSERGYTETLFGRRRYFPGIKSPLPGLRAQAERMATNAPIQGTQSDIIKLAMIAASKLIEKEGWQEKAKLLLQVHDELVYEVDKKDAVQIGTAIRKVMEDVAPTEMLGGVPILAEMSIGPNWGELKKIPR